MLPTPNTRKEEYLNAIATGSQNYPSEPITREEAYLDVIAKNGGGGSEVSVTQIKSSGEKIATITVDGVGTDLYASAGGGGGGAVDTVNGKTGDVVLTASDVGALPDSTSIPSKTSDLNNDSNFVSDASYVHTDNNYDATAKGIVDGVTTALGGKADKSEMSVTQGTGTDADKTTIQLKSGTSAIVLNSHQSISGKADKVASATNGNFAGLDSNGNLTDSGSKASDFATASSVHNVPSGGTSGQVLAKSSGTDYDVAWVNQSGGDVSGKADKVTGATSGDLAGLDGNGNLTDSGVVASSVVVKSYTSGLIKNDGSIDTNTYATTSQIPDITVKADKVTSAVSGNFAGLDSNGNLTDSGYSANSFMKNEYLEQTVTLSTSADTTVTFSNASITTSSLIDVAVSEWGTVPSDVTVTTGVCTVTMPKVDSAHSVTVRIYVR